MTHYADTLLVKMAICNCNTSILQKLDLGRKEMVKFSESKSLTCSHFVSIWQNEISVAQKIKAELWIITF